MNWKVSLLMLGLGLAFLLATPNDASAQYYRWRPGFSVGVTVPGGYYAPHYYGQRHYAPYRYYGNPYRYNAPYRYYNRPYYNRPYYNRYYW